MSIDVYPAPAQSTPSAVLGYAAVTTDQTGVGTLTDLTGLATTVFVPPGRRIKVSFHGEIGYSDATTAHILHLYQDGVEAGRLAMTPRHATGDYVVYEGSVILSPSPGTHSYQVKAQRYVGSGTLSLYGSVIPGAYLLVEDVTGGSGGPGPINLGYAEVQASQAGITAAVDLTGLTLTVTVPAGRRLRISGHTLPSSSVGGDVIECHIYEDGVRRSTAAGPVTGTNAITLAPTWFVTPTAGTHVYKLVMLRYTGTGSVVNNAGAGYPSFISVDDVTGTPAPGGLLPSSQTLAYAENFGNATAITSTLTAIPGAQVTVSVPAGRRIRVTGKTHVTIGSVSTRVQLAVMEGGTIINQQWQGVVAANVGEEVSTVAVVTPSAGVHTYQLGIAGNLTGGSVYTTGTIFNYLLVEDITGGALPMPAASVPVGLLAQSAVGLSLTGFTATPVDVPGSTLNVVVPAGRVLRINASGRFGANTTAGHIVGTIHQDGVEIGRFNNTDVQAGLTVQAMNAVLTSPSAGAHVYKLQAYKYNGGNTADLSQAQIWVEDVTPTPAPANTAPSSTLAYVESTTSLTGAAAGSEMDVPGLSVSVTVPAGRRLRITASAVTYANTVPGRTDLKIMEGATLLNNGESIHTTGGWGQRSAAVAIVSPSAGAHTYKVVLRSSNQQGFIYADATVPAFILVEDITSSAITSVIVPGRIICTSTGRPGSPTVGTEIYETDTGRGWVWNGALWVICGPLVPCARVRATTVRAASNGAWATTVFDVADEDNWGQWSAAAPGRLTCQLAGVYDIQGHCAFTGVSGQSRGIGIRKNLTGSSGPTHGTHIAATNPSWSSCIPISANGVRLAVGDYVELASLASTTGINLILEDGGCNLAWTYRSA